ncbi:EspA/EspE family type VII secretion system effector [Mycobacterium sp. NAZ190054]|uniref:EspA/EspE family type VII secretion system effector n=1 Tax=Mycobacterium sp. NAZ190054 TaxID=1747766 RepID=UPI0007984039|nr:EspA/EspE family type VII secretion system effector [Mycobacterium sp. NAZ190054]KWX67243.1 hypothetical protein ASJ79_22405 [Mycobacterium sp. NAZ190054]
MSALEAFLSTWAKARATFGSGTPQPGASYDHSTELTRLTDELDGAAPTGYWSGGAATAYGKANTDHQRVVRELGALDRRLAEQVDRSAQIVSAGRQNLDAIREWVVAAAASVPKNRAGELMVAPIVQKGLAQLTEVVTRANGELNTVGGAIAGIGGEFQALGAGQKFGGLPEAPAPDGDEPDDDDSGGDESERTKNQIDAFREVFGRAPVSDADWLTASALDPNSYDPKNQGVDANIVVGRIEPVPGQGVVRTNLFIPSEDVWAPTVGVPPYDNNLGDNRGFSPTAGPEASRVAIYTDFENGIIVARQNPSINADTGQVRTGTPSIGAVQTSDGGVLIRYNAADPFSPGGEGLAKASGISVNGTLGIVPSDTGPRVGGDDVTTFPALEIYSDRGGMTTTVLQEWPTLTSDASGPMVGLPFDKDIGDPSVVPSFNSVVPQMVPPTIPDVGEPAPIPVTPPMSIVPPGNFTPFGPAGEAPTVRQYTPMQGTEFLPGS